MGQFRFLTAGESHGRGLVAVVEGIVAGLSLEAGYINRELKRRQQGYGRGPRMAIEQDEADIMSGIRYGLTTGGPIALLIANRDWHSWQEAMSVGPADEEADPVTHPRPGHADLAGVTKYGLGDIRPVMERASARETAARVAAGAVARRFLEELGIAIRSHTLAIGHVGRADEERAINWQEVEASPVRCARAEVGEAMMVAIDEAKAAGDTLGGIFELVAMGVPMGLGSHVSWDRRLDGRIAQAMMSINAVKGVEIGAGFASAGLKGSQAHDVIEPTATTTAGEAKQALPWRHLELAQ